MSRNEFSLFSSSTLSRSFEFKTIFVTRTQSWSEIIIWNNFNLAVVKLYHRFSEISLFLHLFRYFIGRWLYPQTALFKNCQWLHSNRRILWSKATALPLFIRLLPGFEVSPFKLKSVLARPLCLFFSWKPPRWFIATVS